MRVDAAPAQGSHNVRAEETGSEIGNHERPPRLVLVARTGRCEPRTGDGG
jgi:hypothetical protein